MRAARVGKQSASNAETRAKRAATSISEIQAADWERMVRLASLRAAEGRRW